MGVETGASMGSERVLHRGGVGLAFPALYPSELQIVWYGLGAEGLVDCV